MDTRKIEGLEKQIHRTWLELLMAQNLREIAAIALDCEVKLELTSVWDEGERTGFGGVIVSIPASVFGFVKSNERVQQVIQDTISDVAEGYLDVQRRDMTYSVRVKLREPEEDWQNIVRRMIANMSDPNQGRITELASGRNNGKGPIVYNEMKFASKSEIRIAQELEARSILFFPLAMGVRAETGSFYKDHREADFLVCDEGKWGILEVSYHPDRYEKDAEKSAWWKKSGILCVEHYTAERCFNEPRAVVDEFLGILAKHR
jgi:hypothetical protein